MNYPFHMSIFKYAVTSVADETYIFGGQTYDENLATPVINSISKFNKNKIWSNVGTLLETRKSAGAISFDDEIMIIGGRGSKA